MALPCLPCDQAVVDSCDAATPCQLAASCFGNFVCLKVSQSVQSPLLQKTAVQISVVADMRPLL